MLDEEVLHITSFSPHKIIKKTIEKKSTPVDICSSHMIVKIVHQLPLKIVLHYHWKTTVSFNCFISLHLSDLFKHRYNLIKVGKSFFTYVDAFKLCQVSE